MKFTHKYLARLIIEADTPFSVGSGEKGFLVDRLIARDPMGLPYIPGSSLAGVLRHELDPTDTSEAVKNLFGFQAVDTGRGSRIIISSAHLIGADGKTVVDGLQSIDLNSEYYSYFQKLPERDHVRINDRGTAVKHGKYDEEVVHKGTRFAFNMELSGNDTDEEHWNTVLEVLHQPVFRIGAGTRKGFGKLKVINCRINSFNLQIQNDLLAYLNHNNTLNEDISEWKEVNLDGSNINNLVHYQLDLKPKDFFLFGAGFGDEDADHIPKTERYFSWESGQPELQEKDWLLIPATSIKGALAHRVAFHFNMLNKMYIGSSDTTSSSPPTADTTSILDSILNSVEDQTENLTFDDPKWEEMRNQIETMTFEEALYASKQWQEFEDDLSKFEANYQSNEGPVGSYNTAVRELFGYALDGEEIGARGNVIIDDVYLDPKKCESKVFSHVAIDRFTGGVRDGALFQQKVASSDPIILNIYLKQSVFSDSNIIIALEKSLNDLCNGKLQIGGGTTKGHGLFEGTLKILNRPI